MAMYFMNGKTFLNKYVEEDPRKVMRTQFIVVSSTIRKNRKYEKQVIIANNMFFPSQEMIMDYDDYKHNQVYKEEYIDQISKHAAFFATLIKYAIEEKQTIVFLCGEREKKYYYFPLIQQYVLDKFGYHIYDYKKYKEGKEPIFEYDRAEVLRICNKELEKARRKERKKKMQSDKGRKEIIKGMTKKEMIKELKNRCLYYDGMTKDEMKDMLTTFLD